MSKRLTISEFKEAIIDEIEFYKKTNDPIPEVNEQSYSKIKSYLEMPFQTGYGQELYPSVYDKAAILCYLIIKNHALSNGNKRMGILSMLLFLKKNEVGVSDFDSYKLAKYIASSEPSQKDEVLEHIKKTLNLTQMKDYKALYQKYDLTGALLEDAIEEGDVEKIASLKKELAELELEIHKHERGYKNGGKVMTKLDKDIKLIEDIINNPKTSEEDKKKFSGILEKMKESAPSKKTTKSKAAPKKKEKTSASIKKDKVKIVSAAEKEKVVKEVKKAIKEPKTVTKDGFNDLLARLIKKFPEYAEFKGYSKEQIVRDAQRRAKAKGKRISKNGKTYYEYRTNRTDVIPKDKLAKGGVVSSNWGFNKEGNMTHTKSGHVYTIEYQNDKTQLYDLVKDGKVVKSGKEVHALMLAAEGKEYAKGGIVKRDIAKDKTIKAKHKGWRTSADGKEYYEARPNRSDKDLRKKI